MQFSEERWTNPVAEFNHVNLSGNLGAKYDNRRRVEIEVQIRDGFSRLANHLIVPNTFGRANWLLPVQMLGRLFNDQNDFLEPCILELVERQLPTLRDQDIR
jgi:hypothetical protein